MTSYKVPSDVDVEERQVNDSSDDKEENLIFEDLPKLLQFGINYSFHGNKCVKFVAVISWFTFMAIMSFLVFGLGIFDNLYFGFIFFPLLLHCGYAFFGHTNECFKYKQTNSLLFDIIGSDKKIAIKITKYYKYLTLFFINICVVLIIIVGVFIMPAYCARAGIEGVLAFVFILLGSLANVCWSISFNLGVGLDIAVLIFYKDYRVKCLRSYLDSVRDTLLKLKDNDDNIIEVDLLSKLRKEQSNIEKMATKYNIAYSKYYGNQTTTYFIWTFVPLATTFLTKNLFGVIFCCVVGIAFLPFVFIHLSLCAMVNVEWNKAIKKKLKGWDLAPIIKKIFGNVSEFELYLDSHEAGCSTVFGVPITFDLLKKFVGLVCSAFSLLMYLIARNEFQKAL